MYVCPPTVVHRAATDLESVPTTGDMRRPVCGLCERVGRPCVFPRRQKRSAPLSQTRTALQSNHMTDSRRCEDVSDQLQGGFRN